ncbi:hypothetical protein Taro_003696 [Colocasia esculenta]|uniref:Uncharacterized protein n=1 Tax=Colocasia esculenta TaxID=4460 RepID=A0A843THW9_COLES|nr:hypothetical protein [Colocasia esculenta]
MVGGSLGPEEEGPDEEAPAKEDPGRTSTEEEGKGVVEEVKGVGEEICRERGLLGTGGARGAVDEVGGEGGAGVGRVEGSGTTACASPTAAEISRDDRPSACCDSAGTAAANLDVATSSDGSTFATDAAPAGSVVASGTSSCISGTSSIMASPSATEILYVHCLVSTDLSLHKGEPLLLLRSEELSAVAPKTSRDDGCGHGIRSMYKSL